MWKRRFKDRFGRLTKETVENSFTRNPVYDNLAPNANCCNTAELTAEYTVEYVSRENSEAYENANSADYPCEPWELRDEYLTDSLGLAIRETVIRMFDDNSEEPFLYMYLKNKDGKEAEICADIPADTKGTIERIVNETMKKRIDFLQEQVSTLTREINMYRDFLGEYHAERQFKEWRENHGND